jgi:dolichyl-phosphate-mannose--protein O-mannosyl transferase
MTNSFSKVALIAVGTAALAVAVLALSYIPSFVHGDEDFFFLAATMMGVLGLTTGGFTAGLALLIRNRTRLSSVSAVAISAIIAAILATVFVALLHLTPVLPIGIGLAAGAALCSWGALRMERQTPHEAP